MGYFMDAHSFTRDTHVTPSVIVSYALLYKTYGPHVFRSFVDYLKR